MKLHHQASATLGSLGSLVPSHAISRVLAGMIRNTSTGCIMQRAPCWLAVEPGRLQAWMRQKVKKHHVHVIHVVCFLLLTFNGFHHQQITADLQFDKCLNYNRCSDMFVACGSCSW
jgi:hypothetical protein